MPMTRGPLSAVRGLGTRKLLALTLTLSAALMVQTTAAQAGCASLPAPLQPLTCDGAANEGAWAQIAGRLAVLSAAHPALAAPLAEDHALFLRMFAALPAAANGPDELPDLVALGLSERLAFLNAVDVTAGQDPAGEWGNAAARLRVRPDASGIWQVELSVAEPVTGTRSCTVAGEGPLSSGLLEVETRVAGEALSLSQVADAPVMGADFTRNGRPAEGPAACADSPTVNGWYFRLTAAD